ncbi:MAG: formylglycine-generating enzyme family protein [Blastocatellia bacterium]|nr:formylglycine-generating enzyme family protein [Blastocatellia bacterium]
MSADHWTERERRAAIRAFLDSEAGKEIAAVFRGVRSPEDRAVFLRDAERRLRTATPEARAWWDSLRELLRRNPDEDLALHEPLAQRAVALDEVFDSLPPDFEPDALLQAFSVAGHVQAGWLVRGISNTSGWPDERIRERFAALRPRLRSEEASGDARNWWAAFETENESRPAVLLRLAEELLLRRATIDAFFAARREARTENLQAALHFLDYLRLRDADEEPDWWLKTAPGIPRIRGWSENRIKTRLDELMVSLGWEAAPQEARVHWAKLIQDTLDRPALLLRLAEELANRKATIADLHRSAERAATRNLRAALHFLDYLRYRNPTVAFETVTLNAKGEVTERRTGRAGQFIEDLFPGITLEMVEVPAGTFLMGSPEDEIGRSSTEGPIHEVTLPTFFIGKFPVTQAQWRVVANWPKMEREIESDPSYFKGDDRPVENVSWEDAREFCTRLSARTGREYRLPSEAEWEYACRAGTTTPFAFGETITPEIVNYDGNYPYAEAEKGERRGETIPVGSLGVANAFGIYDMHGNVWDWCEDAFADSYEGAPVDGSARLSEGDSRRVLRGGSFVLDAVNCRAARRDRDDARDHYLSRGVRVVVSARTL